MKFEEHLVRVNALELTGNLTDVEHLRLATASYNGSVRLGVESTSALARYLGTDPASPGKPFKFLKSYLWLRTTLFLGAGETGLGVQACF